MRVVFTIQQTPLANLSAPLDTERALRDWSGFVQIRPPAAPSPTLPIDVLENDPEARWQTAKHWKPVPAMLDGIGCHLLRGVELVGPGYALYDSRFIHDGSETAKVSLDWITRIAFANPFLCRRPNIVVEKRPVMVVCGPGHRIWGHWIVEFLPRIEVARQTFGDCFDDILLALPSDAPAWVVGLIKFVFAIPEHRLRRYDPVRDRLLLAQCVIPSFCHSDEWVFHPFVRELFDRLKPADCAPVRHVFVSRSGEGLTSNRVLHGREHLETLAAARGYEVVRPEALTFTEQFALFAGARRIVGEAGSGMHTALVSEAGTIVASLGMTNPIQLRIGELCGHRNVFMNRIRVWDDAGVQCSEVAHADSRSLFDQLDERLD
ncbi:glycosyltransferase family 61 protein [Lichenicoccus sp.]|uniref:glycosyltransferase family 61 protein n=1 Tax=Lichenicoccus sp. TaxID=2781899 RepID=UPI003D14B8D7